MSRYTGPRARINRWFAQSIFTPGNAEERKPYISGMHGPRLRRKMSEYAMGLNEKQKARYTYGMSEKQFRLAFNRAKIRRGLRARFSCVRLNSGWIVLCITWDWRKVALRRASS
jgi:small subunit ribosomal protein S4